MFSKLSRVITPLVANPSRWSPAELSCRLMNLYYGVAKLLQIRRRPA